MDSDQPLINLIIAAAILLSFLGLLSTVAEHFGGLPSTSQPVNSAETQQGESQ